MKLQVGVFPEDSSTSYQKLLKKRKNANVPLSLNPLKLNNYIET